MKHILVNWFYALYVKQRSSLLTFEVLLSDVYRILVLLSANSGKLMVSYHHHPAPHKKMWGAHTLKKVKVFFMLVTIKFGVFVKDCGPSGGNLV